MTSNIKIGPYMLLETLGVGSFGKVKRAVHSLTGHTVAIKIINKNKVVNQDMFARVKREIQYLKLLRHPHIIKLYEVISTPTSIYMVIEYAGGELFNYIVDNTRLSEDEARRFFQQIVCAIEYCHRHKIVHRDLKPENLLLDPSMNVKIADFGLSNIMTDGDFLKTSCGSPNYAAPEVISGKLYAGPEVDVWSCGVILYVMLVGRLPFDDDYIPLLFKKINGGIYSLPSFLSPETKYLLTSMLVVDPLKRITIAEIRQNAWFNVGLPEYLKPLPSGSTEDTICNLQEDIIEELMKKMNFPKETIVMALEERQNNQIKVAYQLVVDHRRMIENASQMSPQKPFQSFLATSPPPWNVTEKDASPNKSVTGSSVGSALKSGPDGGDTSDDYTDSPVPSSIAVLSTSLPGNTFAKELHRKASLKNTRRDRASSQPQSPNQQSYQQNQLTLPTYGQHTHSEYGATTAFHQAAVLGNSSLGGGIPTPATTTNAGSRTSGSNSNLAITSATQRRMKARPKWYFGIRSRSAPREVMAEIYRALSNLSMKWKIINAYHLRAKYEYAEGFEVKIELQLYRLDSENYLVDFKYVGQQSAAEMEARAELMRSINEESQRNLSMYQQQYQQQQQASATMTEFPTPTIEAIRAADEVDADVSGAGDEHPVAVIAQGAAHIMSDPQDIPQPSSSSAINGAEHHLSSTVPTLRPLQPIVSFQTGVNANAGVSASTSAMAHSLRSNNSPEESAMTSMSLPVRPRPSISINISNSISNSASPGILSSSLMQEQQLQKEMNELRQELKHQQRQRDLKQRPTHLLFPKASYQLASATKEVTSPFPFFDVCGKLITELAIGSG
ncbi:kinase-like domain-containing protein [Gamsiella multidivaricata]|uniref:kinase-like domain-containing protein n=1 Tax=Gamsiella multidivaricata TaxID=101098 RepID=UPI00221F58CC|nr:kinase-like domain-containing protein [Gamsiella multidivaricata]KAG0368647.1 Protein kinase [Gamsiella multidivaricata]KAI7822661.1 kinase-like domain-containing protein [Gamsiella multidivaricata]